jgi:hypothetical protein
VALVRRLPWPLAAAVILVMSLAAWVGIAYLMHRIF